MIKVYIFCFLMGIFQYSQAQTITLKEKSMVTDKDISISIAGGSRRDLATVIRTPYVTIYRRDVNSLGLHNPCVYDVMLSYGMIYDVVPEGQRVSERKFSKHNRRVNWKLFWRNGFFWKSRMHKKMKKCRIESGEQNLEEE